MAGLGDAGQHLRHRDRPRHRRCRAARCCSRSTRNRPRSFSEALAARGIPSGARVSDVKVACPRDAAAGFAARPGRQERLAPRPHDQCPRARGELDHRPLARARTWPRRARSSSSSARRVATRTVVALVGGPADGLRPSDRGTRLWQLRHDDAAVVRARRRDSRHAPSRRGRVALGTSDGPRRHAARA